MTPFELDNPNVDALLSIGANTENTVLKDSLWRQTSLRLRRRRRIRVLAKVGLPLICFVGGIITMALLPTAPIHLQTIVVTTLPKTDERAKPERRLTPAELELEAERAIPKEESARHFREAGDRYLRDEDNLAAALRCYRNFLDEAGDDGLTDGDSDTWLLTSLKNARRKEID